MTRNDAIRAASAALLTNDLEDEELTRVGYVVGLHPVWGWVYRSPGDAAGIAELTGTFHVTSFGEEP
jgi:hypothetical protein